MSRWGRIGCAAAVGAGLIAGTAGAGEKPRDEAIGETRAAIARELETYGGGDWDTWAERLTAFRAELKRRTAGKDWPWPAKNGFAFQGAAVEVMLRDRVGKTPEGYSPLEAITDFHYQLRAEGVDLIVVPIPDKLAVYPDYLVSNTPPHRMTAVAMKRLMYDLLGRGVEVIDLYTFFRDYRREHGDDEPLYLARDSHWRDIGSRLAGKRIAERLRRYDFVPGNEGYELRTTTRDHGADGIDEVHQVYRADGKPYGDVGDSPVILTGDSFAMMNMRPASLAAHTAYGIQRPLTFLCRRAQGPSTAIEIMYRHRNKGLLKGRKVLVWTFVSRLAAGGPWRTIGKVPRPAAPGQASANTAPAVKGVEVTGLVMDVSPGPPARPDYDRYVMKLRVAGLKSADGTKVGRGEGVVRVLAMKDRKPLPIASTGRFKRVRLRIWSWSLKEAEYGKIATGNLSNARYELDADHYWGEPVTGD